MENLVNVPQAQLETMFAALTSAYTALADVPMVSMLYNVVWSAAASVEMEMVRRAELAA